MSGPPERSAPWPSMRGGSANLGRARLAPEPRDWPIRSFPTGGPVFSTPVIGAGEQIYVGSADCCFYRLDPESGRVVWRAQTDEIIDSAACIDSDGTVWVPGGDGRIYGFDADGVERWRYDRMLDRTRVTPSTIYWWEGNVVLGPNGWLYAGNDDFYLYAIEPYEGVRWATPTGLHIWGAPAFEDERVFVPSFDRCLYALDLETGRVRWRRNLGNFIASSPAVAEGLVIVGSFDHHVTAVDAADGRVVWRTPTGGPVYASAAVDDDQVVIGSADGVVYGLDLRSGAVRWTRWLGDAIRGSVAVGEHLYVPGGDGWLTALERDGSVKWRHDTRRPGTLCNLNASVALGRHGLATASASGDIVYVPYGAVPDARPAEPERDGPRLVVCRPGGAAGEPVGPGDTVGVRVLHSEGGVTLPGRILSANGPVCPDGSQVHVKAAPGSAVRLRGTYRAGDVEHAFDEELEIPWVESREGPLCEGFRASRLSVQAPSIVPSFDQIGLASLSIDIGILKREGERVIAWGVQRFGMDESGSAVGVPDPRVLYYAFDGTWRDGTLELESGECLFEVTAFPVPLTRLRLVAQRRGDALVGGSLVAETDARSVLRALPSSLPSGALARMRGWFPDEPRLADLGVLASIGWRTLALLPAFLRGMWKPWGLLGEDGKFHGVGGFQVADSPERKSALELVEAKLQRGRVVARWRGGDRADAPGILLLRDGRPVAWPYSRRLHTRREDGIPVRSELDVRGAEWDEAWVLRDHERVAVVPRR
ncbi:MAG: PQQ-like beta-propeller repeat protein [Deltaproteobacteria bacterium]|nr:PQQ-like beta-propeller repeat protein [Deltaproteobacteria bacterium]